MNRVRRLKLVLWMLIGLAASVAAARFLFGMGATTNLSDANPWGVWVGFDVMGGVALAAGGFIVTATVYIFKLERFHSVVRPAVLTAFLGYAAVAVGLLFDLGLPWNIWHMIVFWNPHSPLFEVGWCVMLYLTVLSLEFFPVPAEEFPRLAKIRRRADQGAAAVGDCWASDFPPCTSPRSGSLFLIMPYRLHPLWYSPILPVLFLLSAIALGLAMVMFREPLHGVPVSPQAGDGSAGLAGFGLPLGTAALSWRSVHGFARARASRAVMGGRLAHRPVLVGNSGDGGNSRRPVFARVVSATTGGQWIAAAMAVFGVVFNRIDVGRIGSSPPGWFVLCAVLDGSSHQRGRGFRRHAGIPFRGRALQGLGTAPRRSRCGPAQVARTRPRRQHLAGSPGNCRTHRLFPGLYSGGRLGFGFLKVQPAQSRGIDPRRCNGPAAERCSGSTAIWTVSGWRLSTRNMRNAEGGKESCVKCHHMNLPRDENSACARCHTDMYRPVDAFRHDWHASPAGARVRVLPMPHPGTGTHRSHGRPMRHVSQESGSGRSGYQRQTVPCRRLYRGHASALHRLPYKEGERKQQTGDDSLRLVP